MAEQARTRKTRTRPGPSGQGDPFNPSGNSGGEVRVQRGFHDENLPVGGMTVAEVRHRFADRFEIHPENRAFVNGHEVDETVVLRSGDRLDFMRDAGEKGGSWTRS